MTEESIEQAKKLEAEFNLPPQNIPTKPQVQPPTKREYVEENNKKLAPHGLMLVNYKKFIIWFLITFTILVLGVLYLSYNDYFKSIVSCGNTSMVSVCNLTTNNTNSNNCSSICVNNCSFPQEITIKINSSI